jgi:hypothetical protein
MAKSVKVEYDSQSDTRGRGERTRARARAATDPRDDESATRPRSRRMRDDSRFMPIQSAMDIQRLGFAWAQANTRFWMNTANVFGRLMLNTNERVFGMMGGSTTCPNAGRDASSVDDEFDDEFDDDEFDDEQPRRASMERTSSMMVDDLTAAIREGSDVLVQTAEEFDRAFRNTMSNRRARRRREAETEVEDRGTSDTQSTNDST